MSLPRKHVLSLPRKPPSPLFHTLISQVNSTGTQIRFHKASSGAVQYEPPVIKPRAKRSLLVEQAA